MWRFVGASARDGRYREEAWPARHAESVPMNLVEGTGPRTTAGEDETAGVTSNSDSGDGPYSLVEDSDSRTRACGSGRPDNTEVRAEVFL